MFSILFDEELSNTQDIFLRLPITFESSQNIQKVSQVKSGRRFQNIWSQQEDQLLIKLMSNKNAQKWKDITETFNEAQIGKYRDTSSIVQHWVRVLNPKKILKKWTEEEDTLLLNILKVSPPRQWKKIADQMPDRTDNQIVSRLKAIKKYVIDKDNQFQNLFP
ncbi:Myb-like DNA-binding domain-containing protein [Spironucleus salmonicida]|uniref:Myb-like DNA-binding domain-containing protein n=1 Tax=Spironucleus salmonicida TaxID=348837 RepID=V6LDT2_9EUKA|nr:Myb-like DNA-binding domain-containing protein [Spironucleus salmonicida]|eukprot:EST41846.1 Myb-like DNA-binding domain-containing protein [Spironucleus salmonicida]